MFIDNWVTHSTIEQTDNARRKIYSYRTNVRIDMGTYRAVLRGIILKELVISCDLWTDTEHELKMELACHL